MDGSLRRRIRAGLIAGAVAMALIAAPAAALEAPTGSQTETTEGTKSDDTSGVNKPAASAAEEDDEDTGASSEGSALRVKVAGHDAVVISETESRSGEDTRSGGHVISVLGNELAGTDSEARGGSSRSRTGLGHDLCQTTDGLLCLALLYADARSQDDGDKSSSSADARVASLCVNGEQTDPQEGCDGMVSAGLLESSSSSQNDAGSGGSAEQSSVVARLCINDDSSTPGCDGAGIVLLERNVNSDGDESSQGVTVNNGDNKIVAREHPGDLGLCDNDLLCVEPNHGSATGGGGPGSGASRAEPGLASARAEGRVIYVQVLGTEVLRAGASEAETSSDGTSADATVLAVLGHELIGAHAETDGGSAESETGYLRETCQDDDPICLTLLYGRAEANEDDSSAASESHSEGASACVAGEQARPEDNCTGPVSATVLESHSYASQDKDDPRAEAEQHNAAADVCLGGENADGVCEGIGVVVLDAHSYASAEPGKTQKDADASTITVERGGEEAGSIDSPQEIGIPSYCPEDSAILCVALNDVDTDADAPARSTAAEAIIAPIIGGGTGGRISDGSADARVARTRVLGEMEKRPAPKDPAVGGQLSRTGSAPLALLTLALFLIVLGRETRRRATTDGKLGDR